MTYHDLAHWVHYLSGFCTQRRKSTRCIVLCLQQLSYHLGVLHKYIYNNIYIEKGVESHAQARGRFCLPKWKKHPVSVVYKFSRLRYNS
jgi:hypothetical protein